MTDAEREALVEAMAIAAHERRRRLAPLVLSAGWHDLDPEDQQRLRDEARAALAAIAAAGLVVVPVCLLEELAEDLEAHVRRDHPRGGDRWERDMQPIVAARAALEGKP